MTYFLFLVILLGLVSFLLMVLLGCGIVLLTFLVRSLLGGCRLLVAWLLWSLPLVFIRSVVGLSSSGAVSSFGNIDNGGRKEEYDLPKKKQMCVNVLELILGRQPIPKRWRADTFRLSKCPRSCLRTSVVREPQLAEQLVEVPTLVSPSLPVERCRWPHVGHCWWWLSGSRHTQWDHPEGYTARPGRHRNTGQGWCGRLFDHAARVRAVQVVRFLCRDSVPSTECWTFQSCHRGGDSTVQSLNKVVAVVVYDSCPWLDSAAVAFTDKVVDIPVLAFRNGGASDSVTDRAH